MKKPTTRMATPTAGWMELTSEYEPKTVRRPTNAVGRPSNRPILKISFMFAKSSLKANTNYQISSSIIFLIARYRICYNRHVSVVTARQIVIGGIIEGEWKSLIRKLTTNLP